MCGIIGYFAKGSQAPERAVFERAIDAMEHRGPDDRGIRIDDRTGLGFRRLSVIDIETGAQPMSNEDGRIHIVFNGEIYNFRRLRDRLEAKGHRFRTNSDTEIILHLYEEDGERCVDELRGMFSFAIYDQGRASLFLARDRFGKKPLVYTETGAGFYFASEIGALLKLADCGHEVDPAAVDAYLALRYIPSAHTAWREIKRFPAACTMWVKDGLAGTPHRYWRLNWSDPIRSRITDREAIEGFRERFEEGVKLRMISDVPLGAFLSGGVDSSITTAAMTRTGQRVETFSIGFEDPRFDETIYAQEVARRLETSHHHLRVTADSLENLDPLIDTMGEPFADHSFLPTFLLSKFTRRHVTVALSGDGGDELFGGYKRYRHLALAGMLKRLGMARPWMAASRASFQLERAFNPSRRHLKWPRSAVDRVIQLEPLHQYFHLLGCWNRDERAQLQMKGIEQDLAASFIDDTLMAYSHLRGLSRWQALDVETWLIDDILRKVDTASMACSLECRCPFLDQGVAEFAAGLPVRFKLNRRGESKALLRKLYPDLLPPGLFKRAKKGFSMPIGQWMRQQWKETLRASVEESWSGCIE